MALVSEGAEKALSALAVDEISERDLRTTLLEFGRRLMTIYMTPMLVGVYRCIVTEGQRFPELAIAFYEKGPGRAGGTSDRSARNRQIKGRNRDSQLRDGSRPLRRHDSRQSSQGRAGLAARAVARRSQSGCRFSGRCSSSRHGIANRAQEARPTRRSLI
jgi:hypothetical protein